MAHSRKTNQFVISFGELNLPEALASQLDVAISSAALRVLANLDLHEGDHYTIRPGLDWQGKWVDLKIADLPKSLPRTFTDGFQAR